MNKHKRYLNTKRATSKQRGIPFSLTLSDLYMLLYMARITINDVGKKNGQYVLSRLGDIGGYDKGNVWFIPCEQNTRDALTGNSYGSNITEDDRKRRSEWMTYYNLKVKSYEHK